MDVKGWKGKGRSWGEKGMGRKWVCQERVRSEGRMGGKREGVSGMQKEKGMIMGRGWEGKGEEGKG